MKQVLHVYEVQTGIVLQQVPMAQKHNEVSTLKPLLTEVLCKGRILTADAAQSYHEFGRLIEQGGGDVVVIIKDNTPVTRADLELFLKTSRPIEAPGSALNRSRKAMVVWSAARSPSVLISTTICAGTGARWDRSFACSANAPSNASRASRWSMAGRVFRQSGVPPNVFCS